jgi:hypothetical protein
VQKDNTLVVHSLSEPAAKRAAHVVQASVVEVQIPINVQSDLAPTTLPDPAVFLTPPVLLVFEGTGFCLSIIL